MPSMYSDSNPTTSLDLNSVFNSKSGSCNYNDRNIDVECLRPSSSPNDWFKLYQTGSETSVTNDFSCCTRSTKNPSIGAFEYPQAYEAKTDDEPIGSDFQIQFKINYCVIGSNIVKMEEEFCSWKTGQGYTLKNEGNCDWSYILAEPISSFKYKFVIANGDRSIQWESHPNRLFSLSGLKSALNSSKSGKYES